MMIKKLMWAAALIALVAVAGCGGKKAIDEPAPATDTSAPAVEETRETPVETPMTPSTELDPAAISDVFFDFDSYALSSEAKGTLEGNARELKRATTGNITIEGHCDERGTKAYNLALGEKRANAAKEYLVALGVSAARINIVSYGKERPFDPGHDESAWAKNRRAHFVVDR